MIPQTRKWVPVIEAALLALVFAIGGVTGWLYAPQRVVQHVYRTPIQNGMTLDAIQANFGGPPQIPNQALGELPGYRCNAWVQNPTGANPDPGSWVAILCTYG